MTGGETEAQGDEPLAQSLPARKCQNPKSHYGVCSSVNPITLASDYPYPFPGSQESCERGGAGRPGLPKGGLCASRLLPGAPQTRGQTGTIEPSLHPQEAYSVARQFNLIPPICEQAEYHMFQREKVEVQLPELFHKIGGRRPVSPPAPRRREAQALPWL